MSLFETKYPNNIRTVIGTPIIFKDDVVLQCDTSVGPVTINLLDIPAGYWNTLYKLYVVDISNNASVNNITINAGVGQTINDSSSIVIDTNGGSALVRIVDNAKYIATLSSSGSCCGINFLTNAALQALISGNTLKPGEWYFVTDPLNAEGVLIKGVYSNQITSLDGSGYYLNADYQGVGNYSGVTGFVTNKGIWNTNLVIPVVVGDVMIYKNIHYKNLTGAFGTAPDLDAVNWQALSKSTTTGYISAFDQVRYDVVTNRVIYRADKLGNEVDNFTDSKSNNSLLLFQWGRNKVSRNKLRGQSVMACSQSYCEFVGNILDNGTIEDNTADQAAGKFYRNNINSDSIVSINNNNAWKGEFYDNNIANSSSVVIAGTTFPTSVIAYNNILSKSSISAGNIGAGSDIIGNHLSQESSISWSTLAGSITKCTISNFSLLTFVTCTALGGFLTCVISANLTVSIPSVTTVYTNKSVIIGYSNWEGTLDFTTDYAANILTVPAALNYCGIFNCTNTAAASVQKIVNWPTNHEAKLIPANTEVFDVVHTTIGLAVADNMVSGPVATTDTLTGRVNGSDFVQYGNSGNLRIRTNIVIVG